MAQFERELEEKRELHAIKLYLGAVALEGLKMLGKGSTWDAETAIQQAESLMIQAEDAAARKYPSHD